MPSAVFALYTLPDTELEIGFKRATNAIENLFAVGLSMKPFVNPGIGFDVKSAEQLITGAADDELELDEELLELLDDDELELDELELDEELLELLDDDELELFLHWLSLAIQIAMAVTLPPERL